MKEMLQTSIPTVFQVNIMPVTVGNLLNAVRIWRDNKDGVLHTRKLDIKIFSSAYIYSKHHGIPCIYMV